MTIGEALKKERQKLGLSQTEMVAGVLTKSYYSKIERGLHEIKAADLIQILAIHQINTSDFLEQYSLNKTQENNQAIILQELHEAYYNQDLRGLNIIRKQIRQEKSTEEMLNLDAQAALVEVSLKKDPSWLTNDDKERIRNLIFKTDKWDNDNLRLFSMAIPLFSFEELSVLVRSIFKSFKKIRLFSNDIQEKVAAIAVNYLQDMIYYKKIDQKTMIVALQILDEMTPEPRNCFAKIMASYYKAVFSGEKKKAESILKFLSATGMNGIVEKIRG